VGGDPAWPRDHAAAAALVRDHLGGGAGGRLRPIGEGDFCLALRRGPHVVRVARHAEAAAALRREACVLARVADGLPLPVPRPTFAEPAAGCAFSVHAEVTGTVLTRRRWARLPAAAREAAASDLARFLGALHALPAAAAAGCGVPTIDRAAWAARLREGAAGRLYPRLPDGLRRRLDAALARWSTAAAPPPAVLHRDIAPGHVLFEPSSGRLTGVIDFGDVALGDPARDLVYVYEDFGPALLAAVLRHYPGGDAPTFLARVRSWYLLEALDWALRGNAGADALARELARELDALAPPRRRP
jgi:aminoglycoside phosphotransferase (APT) family kinase protein